MSTPDHSLWSHGELLASGDVIVALMEGYFESSVDSIKEIEINLLYMMQSSKEWNKAQRQYKDSVLRAVTTIEIFVKDYPVLVEFHYSNIYKCITDVTRLELLHDDQQPDDFLPMYRKDPEFAEAINEQIYDIYKDGNYES